MDDVDTRPRCLRDSLGCYFRAGQERPVVLIVRAVEFGGSPPMAQFAIYRVAEQPVPVGDHLPSRLLVTYRLPWITLQRLDTVGETQHQRRRHHLVCQANVGERPKPCRACPLDGLPHAFPHSPALALGRRNDA